jgi:O-antigen/teichoic acid export membrane protein
VKTKSSPFAPTEKRAKLTFIVRQKVDAGLDRLGAALHFDAKYLLKSSVYLFSANTLGMVMGMLLSVTLARVLGAWNYGQYGLVMSIVGTLSIFSLPGMDTAISHAVARGYDQVYLRGVAMKARFALLGALACVPLGLYFFYLKDNPDLGRSFYAAGLLFIPFTVLSSYNSFLYGRREFQVASRFYALTTSFSTCATVLTLLFTRSFLHIMLAYLLSNALCNTFFFWRTLGESRNREMDETSLSYGKHLTMMNVLGTAFIHLDNLLVAYFLSLPDLAVYMVAMALPPQVKAMSKMVSTVLFPKMSTFNEDELYNWALHRLPLLFITSTAIGVVGALAVPYLIPLVYSAQYARAVPHAQILVLGMGISAPGVVLGGMLKSQKRMRELYVLNTILPLVQSVLWVAGTIGFGLIGMVVAKTVSWILGLLSLLWLVIVSPALRKRRESRL